MATCPTWHFIIGPVHLGQFLSAVVSEGIMVCANGSVGTRCSSSIAIVECCSGVLFIICDGLSPFAGNKKRLSSGRDERRWRFRGTTLVGAFEGHPLSYAVSGATRLRLTILIRRRGVASYRFTERLPGEFGDAHLPSTELSLPPVRCRGTHRLILRLKASPL